MGRETACYAKMEGFWYPKPLSPNKVAHAEEDAGPAEEATQEQEVDSRDFEVVLANGSGGREVWR